MDTLKHALRDELIACLGKNLVRELPISKDALLSFGLSSKRELTDKDTSFSFVTQRSVPLVNIAMAVHTFIVKQGGKAGVSNPENMSEQLMMFVLNIEGITTVWVRKHQRKLNFALLS